MKSKKTVRFIVIILIFVVSLGLDQISKSIAREKLEYHEQIEVLGKYLVLNKVENTGAFLGAGDSLPGPINKALLIFLPIIAIGFAGYYLFKKKDMTMLMTVGIALIISGGLGNLYDRIIYGSVTDFIYMDFVLFHTGILNIADVAVTAGFFVLIFDMILNRKKYNEEKK